MRVGGDVVGGHAPRHVERQHHRALEPRQRDVGCGRARATRARRTRRRAAPPGRTARIRRRRAGVAARPSPEQRGRPRPPPLLDPARREDPQRHEQQEQQQLRPANVMRRLRRRRLRRAAMRTMARTRSSSVDRVTASDAGPAERPRELVAARRRRLGEPRAGTPRRGCRPRAARRSPRPARRSGPTSGSSLSRGSVEPDGEQLVAPVEQVQRPLPAGRADEVRHDHDQRPPPDLAMGRLEQRREVGHRRLRRGAARRCRSSTSRSTWARPPAAGIVRSTLAANSIAPTRLPRRVSSRASVATKSTRTRPLHAPVRRPSRSPPTGSGRAGTTR